MGVFNENEYEYESNIIYIFVHNTLIMLHRVSIKTILAEPKKDNALGNEI